MNFIGLDLGSSAIKVLITDENGTILSSASEDVATKVPFQNFREQDANEIFNKSITAMKRALCVLCHKPKIEAIGLSGQMMGMVCLNSKYEPIADFYTWEDQRSYEYCSPDEKLTRITRNIITPAHWLPKLQWMRQNRPQEFASIDKLVFVKDFVRYKLTGSLSLERSEMLGSYLFDAEKNKFSEELLLAAGICEHQLPKEICSSLSIAGYLKDSIAELIGIEKSKVIVVAGGADIAMSAVAHGSLDSDTVGINIGTSGAIYCSCDMLPNENIDALYTMLHPQNGKYLNYGITINAGASLKWANNLLFANSEISDTLEKVMQNMSLKERLLFLPYLNGERSPINDVYAKGLLFGLSQNTTNINIILSVLEGIAFSFKDVSTYFPQSNFSKVVVSGGGSTSQLWCQIISDVMDAQVVSLEQKDASAIGAIIVATCGAGVYPNIQDAVEKISSLRVRTQPRQEYVQVYSDLFKLYKSLYRQTKELSTLLFQLSKQW